VARGSKSRRESLFGEKGQHKTVEQMSGDEPLVWKHEVNEPLGSLKDGYTVEFKQNDIGTGKP
jgi:hypothetical protein